MTLPPKGDNFLNREEPVMPTRFDAPDNFRKKYLKQLDKTFDEWLKKPPFKVHCMRCEHEYDIITGALKGSDGWCPICGQDDELMPVLNEKD